MNIDIKNVLGLAGIIWLLLNISSLRRSLANVNPLKELFAGGFSFEVSLLLLFGIILAVVLMALKARR